MTFNLCTEIQFPQFRCCAGKIQMNKTKKHMLIPKGILALLLLCVAGCATPGPSSTYHDPAIDFGVLRTLAVLPFENFSRDKLAGDRVRDTFVNNLMATGAIYVIPPGEVARGVLRSGILNPAAPSLEEVAKLAAIIKADALITGTVREYGEVKSGTASANVISLSMQMIEVQSKKVVWTASTARGGISLMDRLLGSGGAPMDDVTEAAINDIIDKLLQ